MTCQELTRRLHVNRQLLPVKMTYFMLLAAIGILFPFIAIYMGRIGLSPTEIAIICGITTILCAPARAVFGLLADKLQRHSTILVLCCILSGVFHLSLYFIPSAATDTSTLLQNGTCCYGNQSLLSACLRPISQNISAATGDVFPDVNCSLHLQLKCHHDDLQDVASEFAPMNNSFTYFPVANHTVDSVDCATICEPLLNRSCTLCCLNGTEILEPGANAALSKFGATFWIFFIVYFIASAFFSPVLNMVDGFVFIYLHDKRSKFGHQRLWGTVGFGTFGVCLGLFLYIANGDHTEENYIFRFVLYLILVVVAGFIVCFYKTAVEPDPGQLLSNVGKILRNLEIDFILLTAFISGLHFGICMTFIFKFLAEIGASALNLGLCQLAQCIVEITVMSFSGKIIEKIGTVPCLCISFAMMGVRLLLLSFLQNPWLGIAVESLHGVYFALFYPPLTSYASQLTPPGMHATVQNFVGAMYMSVGMAVGAFAGGLLYEVSPRIMFRVFSAISFGYIAVIVLFHCVTRSRTLHPPPTDSKLNDAEAELEMLNVKPETNNASATVGVDGRIDVTKVESHSPIDT